MNVFSSCWNSRKHRNGEAMCAEIHALGFDRIEVSHGFSMELVPGLIKAVDERLIKVEGVHNFRPAPMEVKGDIPDIYQYTSHRDWERSRALRLTMETMEFAARLGAKYVVLHMGRVHLIRDDEGSRKLERMAREGLLGTREYAFYKGKLMRERIAKAPLYFDRARAALHELAAKAKELNLVLGVEGRSHYEQMPSESEMLLLMEEFADNPHVRYWHDFGHIQRKHNLLLLDHEQYLEGLQPYIYGAHVNDVQWPQRDHRAPFAGGDVDFDRLISRFFRYDMPLSWEISSSVTPELIRRCKSHWDELMGQLPQ